MPSAGNQSTLFTVLALCLTATAAGAQSGGTYQVTNLVSDGSVPATTTDAGFINPWGIADGPAFWVNTQGTGFSYVVQATGAIPFKVTIPAATGGTTATGTPTGGAFVGSATGFVLPNGTKASFLFCSLDGIITGWNSKLGTAGAVAQVAINNTAAGAVYTDMALVTNANGTYIVAANYGKGHIEVYDSTFASATLAGTFTDPNLPAGYVPYAVHSIGTQVFVTYALASTSTTSPGPIVGPGNGVLDVYDTSGNFVARAITGGNLNAPWGVAIAPTGFGLFGGDLLVGNFGDGVINAYSATNYAYQGQLTDGTGKTLSYASLWELVFGNTPTTAGNLNTLYFTAGLTGQAHGLLGAISNNTTATGTATYGVSTSSTAITFPAGSQGTFTVSVAPTNNFTGTVSLSCANLPQAATCTFSPGELNVTPGAVSTSTVIVNTVKSYVLLRPNTLRGAYAAGTTAALMVPFGTLLALRRRLRDARSLRLFSVLGILLVSAGFLAGCSTTYMPPPGGSSTPPGTSPLTIQATSGSITQTATIMMTVQ